MLLDSPKINTIDSNFISLFERTIKKGVKGQSDPKKLKTSVKRWFSSATYKKQLDNIINDLYTYTIKSTDRDIKKALGASLLFSPESHFIFANDKEYLTLTEEAVRLSLELSEDIIDSILLLLQDDAIYLEHPEKMARRVTDLWGGQKYRAIRFCRTFNADVATNTALHRLSQQGIEECQFMAHIDSRTSLQCRTLNGTVFRTDSPEARQYRPPLHHHCRSIMLPLPYPEDAPDSLRFKNRDFSQLVDQSFNPIKETTDKATVKQVFKDIRKFRENWGIPQYILDDDIEKRLAILGLTIPAAVA